MDWEMPQSVKCLAHELGDLSSDLPLGRSHVQSEVWRCVLGEGHQRQADP